MNSKQPKKANGHSRRKFLKSAGLGALAVGLAPAVLRADGPVIVGAGSHKYEWISTWAQLPEGKTYGNAHSVQLVDDGRFFIHHQHDKSVCIFDPDGKFMDAWGSEYASGAHGMQHRKEGTEEFLYLATTGQHSVVKTDLKGKVVWKLEGPPKENEFYSKAVKDKNGKDVHPSYSPTNIALMPDDGDIYVGDGYGSSFVHQYTKDGKFVRFFGGGKNKDIGHLNCPHGIFIDQRGGDPLVVVADRSNRRLHYFKPDGQPLQVVTEELRSPCHFDSLGSELLIPDLEGRVTIFDKDNRLVVHLGDNPDPKRRGPAGHKMPPDQWKDGLFHNPHGACFDKAGNIYVTEWLEPIGRVTKLKKLA